MCVPEPTNSRRAQATSSGRFDCSSPRSQHWVRQDFQLMHGNMRLVKGEGLRALAIAEASQAGKFYAWRYATASRIACRTIRAGLTHLQQAPKDNLSTYRKGYQKKGVTKGKEEKMLHDMCATQPANPSCRTRQNPRNCMPSTATCAEDASFAPTSRPLSSRQITTKTLHPVDLAPAQYCHEPCRAKPFTSHCIAGTVKIVEKALSPSRPDPTLARFRCATLCFELWAATNPCSNKGDVTDTYPLIRPGITQMLLGRAS